MGRREREVRKRKGKGKEKGMHGPGGKEGGRKAERDP